MDKNRVDELEYTPPKIVVLETSELLEKFGPVINCSSFGGSVTNC